MTQADLIERVCTAYAWQRGLGNQVEAGPLCQVVSDRSHPNIWDANHVGLIRAATSREIEAVLAAAERGLAHCAHRLYATDPLTPPPFVARLALDDYRELTPTLQLVLDGALRATPPTVDLRPVDDESAWESLHALLRLDHAEGARTHTGAMPEHVTRGMLDSYRRKAPAYRFLLARADGTDCAYGAAVLCPNGLGMVEDLFTLPAFRRRGIASAVIAHAVADLRARGAAEVLIGAHVTDQPKHLYARLGFAPLCITRQHIRQQAERSS
jgi:GNAT superfamily N-acetyltransferase